MNLRRPTWVLAGLCLGVLVSAGCEEKARGACLTGFGTCVENVHSGECEVLNGRLRVNQTCSGRPISTGVVAPSRVSR